MIQPRFTCDMQQQHTFYIGYHSRRHETDIIPVCRFIPKNHKIKECFLSFFRLLQVNSKYLFLIVRGRGPRPLGTRRVVLDGQIWPSVAALEFFKACTIVGGTNLDTGYNRLFARYEKKFHDVKELTKQTNDRKILQIFNNYLYLLNKNQMMHIGFI